jgi:hypothetical protein
VNWVKTAGGTGYELSHAISAADDGSAYIAGIISGEVAFDTIALVTNGLADPFLTRLDFSTLTGIYFAEAGDGLKIYPNPANDRIFLEDIEGMELYRIINNQGIEVKTGILSGLGQDINISDLPSGVYMLELSGKAQSTEITKLIIY